MRGLGREEPRQTFVLRSDSQQFSTEIISLAAHLWIDLWYLSTYV